MDTPTQATRLSKYLALQLGISRREADELIAAKRVQVNQQTAILGEQITPSDHITVDDTPVASTATLTYLLFNKPAGYVCSRKKQGAHETIYALLPKEYHRLKPVGRLDRDSSGLLLLTNDGDTAYKMTHPKFYKTKIYKVRLNRDLEPLHQQMINDFGVQLEDGPSKFTLERLSDVDRREWQITMHEGRNRQIRRTFAALGYETRKLHRTQFGAYTLDTSLKSGHYQQVELHR